MEAQHPDSSAQPLGSDADDEPARPDPDAPGNFVDDGEADDVPEPNEPA